MINNPASQYRYWLSNIELRREIFTSLMIDDSYIREYSNYINNRFLFYNRSYLNSKYSPY